MYSEASQTRSAGVHPVPGMAGVHPGTDLPFSPESNQSHNIVPFDFSSPDTRLLCDNFYTNGSSGLPKMPSIPPPPIIGLHAPPPIHQIPPPLVIEPSRQSMPPVSMSLTAGPPPIGLQVPPPLGPVVPEPGQNELHHHYLQVNSKTLEISKLV